MFNDYLERWGLKPDGKPIITATSKLLPIRVNGLFAMLKTAVLEEEKRGGLLMIWWEGWGAARVLAQRCASHGTRPGRDISGRSYSQWSQTKPVE
jgi:streptomycin 6-kinase